MPAASQSPEVPLTTGVRVFCLGRFGIEVGHHPWPIGPRGQRKPLGLLKALIAHGGHDVHEHQLSDALWPELDGDHAHRAFKTNLYRLRKLLGRETLRLEFERLSLLPERCWVDALVLPARLDAVARASRNHRRAEAWRHMEYALGLYHGHFLEGESDPSAVLSTRERLHDLYLRHLAQFGSFLRAMARTEEAIGLYQRGLQVDDLAEELYQGLMECLLALEHNAEGLSVYERCSRILFSKAGRHPSPETEALHSRLLATTPP